MAEQHDAAELRRRQTAFMLRRSAEFGERLGRPRSRRGARLRRGDHSLLERNLITRARNRGTAIATACAGTFPLAEAGILDGLRATTTWWLVSAFRARYPTVQLDQGQMVIRSEGITKAGGTLAQSDPTVAAFER